MTDLALHDKLTPGLDGNDNAWWQAMGLFKVKIALWEIAVIDFLLQIIRCSGWCYGYFLTWVLGSSKILFQIYKWVEDKSWSLHDFMSHHKASIQTEENCAGQSYGLKKTIIKGDVVSLSSALGFCKTFGHYGNKEKNLQPLWPWYLLINFHLHEDIFKVNDKNSLKAFKWYLVKFVNLWLHD